MHDETLISGAIPMRDDDMSKKTKKKDDASTADSDGGAKSATKASAAADKGNPLNPYCTCAPCNCTPPCTCGLKLTARETRTEWVEDEGCLRHVVTEVWEPKTGAKKA